MDNIKYVGFQSFASSFQIGIFSHLYQKCNLWVFPFLIGTQEIIWIFFYFVLFKDLFPYW